MNELPDKPNPKTNEDLVVAAMTIQHDANVYLKQSPVLYADIYTHADNVTTAELSKMRAKLDAADDYAKTAILFAKAVEKLMASKTLEQVKENKQLLTIAMKELEASYSAFNEH